MERWLRTTLLVLGVLVVAAMLFGLGFQLYWGLTGPSIAGAAPMPMMRGTWGMHSGGLPFDRWGMHPAGNILGGGMGLGWLFSLGVLALAGFGIYALVRGRPAETSAPRCAHCGYAMQAAWVACPKCGEKV